MEFLGELEISLSLMRRCQDSGLSRQAQKRVLRPLGRIWGSEQPLQTLLELGSSSMGEAAYVDFSPCLLIFDSK